MMRLVFVLGREPELSIAEIAAVVGDAGDWSRALVGREALVVAADSHALIQRLGGTIKIGEELGIMNHEAWSDPSAIAMWLEKQIPLSSGKTCFGFSVHDLGGGAKEVMRIRKSILHLGPETKRLLREAGRSARWVTSREATLSSVVVAKNKLIPPDGVEFLVLATPEGTIVARTLAVQPFEEWGSRDYGRPSRSMERGMLPPKLARMMVNIGSGSRKLEAGSPIILDPFCGTGTVLMEAMRLGYRVLGSDIDPKAIAETRENLCWVQRTGVCAPDEPRLAAIAAEHVSAHAGKMRVDAIVTEPYLGPVRRESRIMNHELRDLIRELHQLYLAAFREFAKALKPHGRVVFIVPAFRTDRSRQPIADSRQNVVTVDITHDVERLGYRIIPPFPKDLTKFPMLRDVKTLAYARPDQRIIRRFLIAERTS